ncbi:hypothetical protein [Sorangium sp. So ce854]|uniref:hypothetical protein n=1 Tax=Sorangium sp. So ce854 TaxID=3133322 RepID=UPI003F641F96
MPRTPVEGFDLAAYAAVSAQLAGGREARDVVLARAGLDEARWLRIETTWLLRLATAALQGDLSLNQEHDTAFLAARAAGR